jgi:sugar/nucleoside kinase (ribokinase family)
MSDAVTRLEMPDYLVFGDLGVDSVAKLDHLPQPDDKIWVEPAGDFPGGMMGNSVATAASLGIRAGVVALIGDDSRGALVLAALRDRGVETRFVRVIEAPTFWTLSLTVPSGDRALIQFPTTAFGADWTFDRAQLNGVRWVHTVAEQGDPVAGLLRDAQSAGAVTSLDIEYPYVLSPDLPELVASVDVAFCNSTAAESLGGLEQAARHLQGLGATTVLVTLGERGALLLSESGELDELPPTQVDAIDTNGAGDAFAAGFAAGRLKGWSDRESAELAVFIAGQSTTALGGFGPGRPLAELRDSARDAGFAWWGRL